MELSEIDRVYALYNKRYNFEKMAVLNGLSLKQFNELSSKDKFLVLSDKLRQISKVNLASYLYGKLFDVCTDITALVNRVECLIELNEYEEALKCNNIGYELVYEDDSCNQEELVWKLNYQKCVLAFYMKKNNYAQWFCEENIIDYGKKEFYYLLFAIYISCGNTISAHKFFLKYGKKFGNEIDFITECLIHMLKINRFNDGLAFISSIYHLDNKSLETISKRINGFSSVTQNRQLIKEFITKQTT